jgi:hypothetical protein
VTDRHWDGSASSLAGFPGTAGKILYRKEIHYHTEKFTVHVNSQYSFTFPAISKLFTTAKVYFIMMLPKMPSAASFSFGSQLTRMELTADYLSVNTYIRFLK